jgi:DNA-binding transcriptional MocR family regulator
VKKFEALYADLERKLNEGHYRPGQKLPSVRGAAEAYGCSVSTVIRAYSELERRHLIYSVPQSGYYAVATSAEPPGPAGGKLIDFSPASPDLNVFPYLDFQHCLNKAIDTYRYNLFTYGESLGLDKLRRTLVSHLADGGVLASEERIVVTSGVQQALEILAKMPFPNGGRTILVEQPSYEFYLRYLEAEELPVRGIARKAEGIDLGELEERFKAGGVKFFYTMPRCHNPLGTTYSAKERREIARLARKYDVFVVEDDYMADLGDGSGYEPIWAFDGSAHVVYLKSFSKIIFPGLRLGAAVLPDRLQKTFHDVKRYTDTSLLSQAALEVYIRNGMYARHKRTIARQYAERMQVLRDAVRSLGDASPIRVPDSCSGVYMPFLLPQSVNLERLIRRLEDRNVHVKSGKSFYLSGYLEREKLLRISISRVQPEQIVQGVRAIAEETERAMG